MTISNASRTAGPFVGNGITNAFPFTYRVFSRSDVLVAQTVTATGVETLLTLDADYTVALNADQNTNPGGVITTTVPPPVGTTLAATSDVPIVQTLDLTNQGGFYPRTINDALDKIVINIQQLKARVGLGSLNVGAAAAVATVLGFIDNVASSVGSSLMGFMPSGVGAIMRTVQDKLRDQVNIKDFGAKGDGVTDDTAALQAAIAALPNGGRINFNIGTYVLTQQIITTNGITLVGAGVNATTLKLKGTQYSTFLLFYGVTGGGVSNMTIDGNRANNQSGVDHVAVQGARCRYVSFHDLHIRDVYGKGVGFDGGPAGFESYDNRIYSVSITNCKEQAIIVDGSSGTNKRTTISNFSIYDTGHAGVAINDGCEDVTVSNGVIDCNNSVWDCVSIRNAKRVAVSNVIGKRGRNGLYVQWNLNACEDVVVNGCVFDTNQQNGVLVLSAKRTILTGITCRNNNQGNVGACAFNVSRGTGTTVESEYTTISGCNAVDDQVTPTQRYGYSFSGSPVASTVSSCNAVGNIDGQYNIANTVASSEITVMSGGNMRLRDTLKWLVTSAAGNLIEFWRDTDTVARFVITQNGQLEWGTGSAVRDVTLFRSGTNLLATNKKFIAVGGLGIGLSSAGISAQATTPAGNTAYKLAIYDSANNLVGYIPIYANPW